MALSDSDLRRQLFRYIAYFISDEIQKREHNDETIESLEVAKQCLENAFSISIEENAFQPSLLDIFAVGLKHYSSEAAAAGATNIPEPSDDDRDIGEKLKTQGNLCMAENRFQEAVDCYSRAIDHVPNNAVYYCNRAAAYSRLNDNEKAIEDCSRAIKIDPNYSKAYGRMGLAYSGLNNYTKAVECYKKALALDPGNSGYQQNLSVAENRIQSGGGGVPQQQVPPGLRMPGGGGLDLNSMLNNPAIIGMTRQLMNNPQMQQMMGNFISSMMTGAGGTADPADPAVESAPTNSEETPGTGPAPEINDFLRMGQQLAHQMQSSNPQMVESLRQRYNEENQGDAPPDSSQPPHDDANLS